MRVEKRKGKSSLLTINGITKSTTEWAKETGVDVQTIGRRIREGWTEENLFQEVKPAPRYAFNEKYFDTIDDEHKAYWLGFIWCDGYMAIRNRKNRKSTSYEFKLTLKEEDYGHLEKFNQALGGSYKINYYNMSSGFVSGRREARLLITNQHFGKTLVEKYGLIPNRKDCTKIINGIPDSLMKHFIRGAIDADGSISQYDHIETRFDKNYLTNKITVSIGGHFDLLKHIEKHLVNNGVIGEFDRKVNRRHDEDGRDGEYRSLQLSGKIQGLKILHYIYDDATVYLDRKYEKFLSIVKKLEGLDEVQAV